MSGTTKGWLSIRCLPGVEVVIAMVCASMSLNDGSMVPTSSISGDMDFSRTISACAVGIELSSTDFGGYVGSDHVVGNCGSLDLS